MALSWTKVANATGYYVHIKDVTAGQTTFTELPYPVSGPKWTVGLLINGHTYQFQLQSINGLIRGGLSNIVTKTPQLPPIPPASRTASVSTGWIHAGTSFFEYVQLYDVTGRITGSRSGSTMTISQHWDSNGKHVYDGIFRFQLWDCTTAPAGDPVSGTPAWENIMVYENNPTITSANATASVAINPQHYYVLRVIGAGDYDSQIGGKSASFAPSIPPFTDLIPFDARTNCF